MDKRFHPSKDDAESMHNAKGFPFASYEEFIEAFENKKILGIGEDRMIAREWAVKGKHAPKGWSTILFFLHFFHLLIYIAYVVYVVLTGQWLLLLALPLFLVLFIISLPSWAAMMPSVRVVIYWLLVAGFFYGILQESTAWMLIAGLPLVVWHSMKFLYEKSGQLLRRAAIEHEDLLFFLWEKGFIHLMLANGTRHWNDFYVLPDGQHMRKDTDKQ